MKRDIQINYGILDQIIEQLHTYKNALNQMHSSLTSIAVYVESNAGKSLDVWDDTIQQSKKNITSYQAQIDDLLSLFENYVTDTTAYITPISRNSMMRVDRNDIWWNLTQIESGVNNNMFHAILETHKSPSFLFGLFDDPTPEEKERSRHNKQKLDAIRTNIESSKAMLEKNIEGLWDIYETKVKKFENVDDEYSNKASAVKDTYTNFFEGVSDVVSVTVEGVWNFIKGVGVAVYEIAEGLISLVIDAGIIAISNNIPDFIEPEFLKKAANTRVETFAGTLEQIIDDPIIVLESVAQSLSDTSEKEGIMYVTGGAATSLIPYVGQSKYLKLLKVEKDKATNTKAVNPAISQKVKEIVQNNKVFEGIKKETVELYKDIKNGGTRFIDDVTHFLGRTLFPNQTLQMSTANSVPVNVFSRSTVEDRIDSVVSRSSVKVEEKGTGDGTKGTGNGVNYGKYSTNIDDKVKVIEKVDLPDWIMESFTDSNYRTVITEEDITFYRTYGGGAKANGSFVTTRPAGNRINAKIDTALVPDWKNTREFEAIIEVPKGQILNIGRVEKQYTKTGALLEGDADQILLPQGWQSEWIKDIRKVPSK
ncbi:hypothetical protein [Bacillus weihaiensis]|uniref:hypothetical protein n=1 Tax=Bacillus weihaiensis TaxID=1547283 RepID=UPI0009351BB8|nr:hypothetical protein [Bacillus weihaiensis]